MSYQVVNNIIIFNWDFNEILDNKIIQVIKLYDTVYFNNYDNIEICIKTENKYDEYICKRSKFNQPINNLPISITHLTLGWFFNQPINNLPNSITNLTLNHNFNQPINDLPNSITHLILGHDFNQPINKFTKLNNIFKIRYLF